MSYWLLTYIFGALTTMIICITKSKREHQDIPEHVEVAITAFVVILFVTIWPLVWVFEVISQSCRYVMKRKASKHV